MRSAPIVLVLTVTLLAVGSASWLHTYAPRETGADAAPPAPPSPIHMPASGQPPDAEHVERDARERDSMLALEIERALVARDPQQRETAFAFLLPELLRVDARR